MATKINTNYYGAENTWTAASSTWGDSCKRVDSSHTFMQLAKNDALDLDDESLFDLSCVPWGVPRCSVASCAYPLFLSNGAVSNFLGYFTPLNEDLDTQNNALCIVSGGGFTDSTASSLSSSRLKQKQRIIGKTKYYSNTIASSLSADNNGDLGYDSYYDQGVVTYLDYQKTKVIIDNVAFIDKSSVTSGISNNVNLKTIAFKDIPTAIENEEINDDWQVNCFSCRFIVNNNTSSSGTIHPTFASKHKVPLHVKNTYSNGELTEWVQVQRNVIGSIGRAFGQNTVTAIKKKEDIDILGSTNSYLCDSTITAYANMSEHVQKFDDIEYNWVCSTRYATGSAVYWLEYGEPIVNASMRYFSLLKTNGESIADVQKAILHEVAFLGFPFITDETYVSENIGDTHVYLPIFDEHMMTTGEFKTGSDALTLNNATWGDIFDDGMPTYDPSYIPPEPEPDENDYGYLNNKATTNRVYSSNNRVYALTESQYNQLIKDINSLYLNDADGFDKFQLDFKGTNPTDYIVGSYGYTFLPAGLIPNQTAENIQIGAVTLPNAQGYRIAPAYIYNYKSLGEIDLTGAGLYTPFGDFRDFEPYTSIELYVPLCGNIKLDPATVVGHTIQIEMRFDIMTGNATACVYRDNSTLIATIAGQLAATLPLSAGRMGDYQNAIKQAENALKQNELKTATAAATVAIGVGAALLAPETGGLSLAAYGAAVAGASSLMSLSNQKNEIEYEITHKQPSIAVCSAANGAVAQNISSMYAVCYIKQCKMMSTYNAETYAHTIGHACVINSTIGEQVTNSKNSFIKCGNVDLSGISATASETSAIQSLLTSGVYV